MTYSISDESLDESHDETMDGAVEQKQPSAPRLSQKRWGLLLGGTLLLAGGAWSVLQFSHSTHAPETTLAPAITVETLTIRARPIANTLQLSGTIRPVEQATLSTRVMGRITQLSLEAGDRFQKGDVLARIDVMDMAAQTSQAEAGVAQAQAEVARSQATLNQLESQRLEAQAALRLAQINQSRMAQLQAEGAVSQSRLDEANTALDEARARVAQSEAGIRQAQAAIAQSRAAVNRAESGVTSASASESYGTVIAPFDGVVVQKLAYEGEMTSPGTALLRVENPDRLQLEISVPEENLRFVQVGQSVQVRIDAVNQTLNARIEQIVPTADPNSRSFLVKIPLNNSDRLISGMFGRIALPLGEQQETILIPTSALIQRGQLQGVYVVNTNDTQATAVLRWVKSGQQRDGEIEIVSGLMEGDRIITNHINQLSDGQPVSPQS
ncbi:efflux RND transporter periplasmic adaptor subunit [Oscillatoria sp. FACHB-1407]|uniref:efflux RND transporter periplasmic adaptor subunit n=1 Tax=Oscillatoria sp. FACHB-1407 TaxID=2692847 RepID=UPI001685FAB4|nr:efflux RND transporter periplasmic adaptor subunit [Oscillatoria sp. FACHB-1407]MBD2465474.1 efflux RND transporter periplasmic adaptor subunit [Oscillatoria sp. FACHB-1407]